jgi:Family of unknown function (DUF5670)
LGYTVEKPSLAKWRSTQEKGYFKMGGLVWGIIVILVVLWLLGFALHIGGGLIHIIIVVAVILVIINLLTGRGARV